MTITILAFGVIKDIVGGSSFELHLERGSVTELTTTLEANYPGLRQLKSYAVAINENYASRDAMIQPGDEVALIPPVSGG